MGLYGIIWDYISGDLNMYIYIPIGTIWDHMGFSTGNGDLWL